MSSIENELTYRFLSDYIKRTERALQAALATIDPHACCSIFPSTDIGFPYDVIRLAGGFPTGLYVEWKSSIPFIPIDSTINTCTSSVIKLSEDISGYITNELIVSSLERANQGIYKHSFNRGNHFIIFAKSIYSGQPYLILHSTASEFTKTYNGLYPSDINWYNDSIQVYRWEDRLIRFLKGKQADLFFRIAESSQIFNEVRHEFMTSEILRNICDVVEVNHFHHYGMPSNDSILIGSYLCEPGDVVPIFSYPGDPISLFKVDRAKYSTDKGGIRRFLVPHGWGKYISHIDRFVLDFDNDVMSLNSLSYKISDKQSLFNHPDLRLRKFSFTSNKNSFIDATKNLLNGSYVDILRQEASFSGSGFSKW